MPLAPWRFVRVLGMYLSLCEECECARHLRVLFGPPRGYWCMRFEAKNQEHKAAAKTGNYRDVPKTVSHFWVERSMTLLRKQAATQSRRSPTEGEESSCILVPTDALVDSELSWIGHAFPCLPKGLLQIASYQKVIHLGLHISVGAWVLISQGGTQRLCKVTRIARLQSSITIFMFRVQSWDAATILVDDHQDHVLSADESSLATGRDETFVLSTVTVTLLVSSLWQGKRRFVEHP